jgi:hypothetical protein
MKTTDNSTIIKLYLKMQYLDSEVTSGEFIHTVQLPERYGKNLFNKDDIIQGIQEFLDWDESPETFDVIKFGNYWYTTNHFATYEDYFEFNGINYPTKILNVTIDEHEDDDIHSYLVAPESLYDAIEDEDDNEIDNQIYHYIEDEYWDLPNEVLAKEHLDIPMTWVEIDED